MEQVYFERVNELKKNKAELEQRLNVKITLEGKKAIIEGESVDEYEAVRVLEAIAFGFSAKKAIILTNENFRFQIINIKHFTRRKDMEDVRARVIGTEGKTKRTIETITGCSVMVKENQAAILGPVDSIEDAVTAIGNIAKGTKQANVYRFLERMNAARREKSDLGLKPEKED